MLEEKVSVPLQTKGDLFWKIIESKNEITNEVVINLVQEHLFKVDGILL